MTFALNIDALNAIGAARGRGRRTLILDALNDWAVAEGAAGGHTYKPSALNAIAVALGAAGGHARNVDALNAIAVALGGAGGHARSRDAYNVIAPLIEVDVDLSTASLPASLTGTGGANGRRFDASGNLVAATAPRLDYNRATSAVRGLLVEPAATNIILQSTTFSSGSWGKASATVTANNATGIDGTVSADLVTATANVNQVTQFPTLADSTQYCYSHVIKRSGGNNWCLLRIRDKANASHFAYFNYATGALGGTTGTVASRGIESLGGGWYLIWMVVNSGTGATAPFVQVSTASADLTASGTTGDTYWLDAAQLEVGSKPSSRIVTTTAAVTRTADAVATGLIDGTYRFTFDDASTQDAAIVGGLIPTTLNRPHITRIQTVP